MRRTRGRVVLAVVLAVGLGLYAAWGAVMRPQGDQRVAYHLHGRNLDAQAWNDDTDYTSMVQARWAEQGVRPPIVVGVSFGPVWLLAAQNAAPKSGLLEMFRDRVLPAVEAQTGPPRARLVFGESMGGVNALAAGLRDLALRRVG